MGQKNSRKNVVSILLLKQLLLSENIMQQGFDKSGLGQISSCVFLSILCLVLNREVA
jgi:hypothetical protein